jgi:hypothetical protein
MGANRGGLYGRIAVTLIAPIAALGLARIPMPGVDFALLQKALGIDPMLIGIGCLALRPFLSAALLVELLALLIPRWRVLRLGGYAERDRLWTRVVVIALVLALLQAFFMARWLIGTAHAFATYAEIIPGDRHGFFWIATQMLSIGAGTFLIYWLARLVDRYGAGNGFAVMIVAFMVEEMGPQLVSSVQKHVGDPILVHVGLAAVAVAVVARLASGRPLKASAQPPGGETLPTPASGLQPIVTGAAVVALPVSISKFAEFPLPEALTPGTWMNRILEAAIIGALCLLATWLFNRPRLIAQAWKRGGPTDAASASPTDRVRAAFARSLALALAICWVVMAVEWFCADADLAISVVSLTVIACVVVDVAAEIGFRHRHGALIPLRPVHRLFMLPVLLKALETAGIPAFARGRRYRTLWNFVAPFVPVDILVPAAHAGAAEAIVRVRTSS